MIRPTNDDTQAGARRLGRLVVGLLLLTALTLAGPTAWAYWTSSGDGTGSATTATLNSPTLVMAVATPGLNEVGLTWTAPTGLGPTGYYVTRTRLSDGSTAPACTSSPSSLVTSPCTDSPVLAGTYRYTVTAVYNSWTAMGADSNFVTVLPDATPPVVTVTTVNGAPRVFPYRTNAPVTTIGGACGTAAGDVALVTPLVAGTPSASVPCGSGSWAVTLGTPIASGTVTLSATQGDQTGNLGTAPAQDVIIDLTPPTVVSILRDGASPIVNAGPLSWTVTFSEPVSGVAASNFTLATSGLSGGTPALGAITAVGGAPSATWTVTATLNGATGSAGSVGLDLTSSGSIADAATNALGTSSFTGQAYTLDTAPPTVTGVSATATDGRYGVGQVIPVTVTFSEPVTVTGTPRLTLATGSPAAAVGYTSGSGSSILTFTYTVAAGHASSDLDYVSTTSLALDGGAIVDAVGNAAILTLSGPGAPGSLGAAKALVIDTTPPIVTLVSSSLADGRYGVGRVVPVTVTFSEAVTVSGAPQLTLATGTPTVTPVDLTSGSGSTTLTFGYVVAAGNSSGDLDYASTTALALNGGTITDAAGNPATLTLAAPGASGSLGFAKNLVIDTAAPIVAVTQVGGTARTFPYVTTADVTSIGGTCGIATGDLAPVSVLVNGSIVGTVNCSAGATWTLPVSWTTDGTRIVSATQSDTATNTGTAPQRSVVVDKLAPTVVRVSSTVPDGSYREGQLVPVTVIFSEPVLVTGSPRLTLRTRLTGGPPTTAVDYSSGSGTDTLTFNYTVAAGHASADLDYAATNSLGLTGATIQDAVARDANRTLATPGAPGSLGATRNIVIDTTGPTVSSVSSPLANGRYGIGQVIPVTVTFNEPMTVTGTPQLTLATGSPAATAVNYTSGSGTATLTFEYTVAAGNSSGDLNYQATTSLALNGGTMTDLAGNAATLTLPAVNAGASLGGGKALVIDTVVPTVTAVSSSLANGSYRAGQVVPVTVTFSEAVTVTGTPRLALATGTPLTTAVDYTSGSGTTVLTFTYTVAAGNTSGDLDYASVAALALNGGTIADLAGNGATLTLPTPGAPGSLGNAKALVIDTTAPAVTVTRVNGSARTFPWSTSASVTSIGGTCGTAIGDATTVAPRINGAGTTPTTATCTAGTWTLTLGTALSTSGTRTLSATQTDAAGNTGTAPDQTVIVDRTPPTVSSIVRTGASQLVNAGPLSWTVTFSEPVSGVATSNFGLTTSGISGTPVLTAAPVGPAPSATWTVSAGVGGVTGTNAGSIGLNLTASGSIVDVVGNLLGTTAFTGQAYTYDTAGPTVTGVSSTLADGSYRTGQVVPVTVTFSEPVTVSGTPLLTLGTGSSATTAVDYTSGSGGTTLTFEYTVADGDTSADLDYAATTSLALNGGAITDAAGNTGVLTLPAPGAAGSLGAGKALVIDTTPPDVQVTEIEPLTLWILRLLRVSGTAEVGAGPVTVFLCATTQPVCDASVATQTFTNVAVGVDGTWLTGWSLEAQGTWYARATQTDAAGNVGTSSLAGPITN